MSAPMEEEPRTIRNKGIIIKRKKSLTLSKSMRVKLV